MPSSKSLVLCALASAALCSGCVVSAPPEYDPPARSPIVLDLVNAQPLVTRIIVVPLGEPLVPRNFRIPLRSEDPPGDRVRWALHVNYGLPQGFPLWRGDVPPGTFQEERSIVFALEPRAQNNLEPGCNQLTLVVGHDSLWDDGLEEPVLGAAVGYAAHAVWYLNMRPDPLQVNDLLNCASPDQVEF